jgi:hypothetical protein
MDETKQVWSTADIIKNRNNWTLASDVELLKHIQSLSEVLAFSSIDTYYCFETNKHIVLFCITYSEIRKEVSFYFTIIKFFRKRCQRYLHIISQHK